MALNLIPKIPGIMAIPVVEFSREGYKIRKIVLLKINCSQMKLLNFRNWTNGEPQ